MKEIIASYFREVSDQLAHSGDSEQRAELQQTHDNLLKTLGSNPNIPYEQLGTTGEEQDGFVDLEIKPFSVREPRLIFKAGQIDQRREA